MTTAENRTGSIYRGSPSLESRGCSEYPLSVRPACSESLLETHRSVHRSGPPRARRYIRQSDPIPAIDEGMRPYTHTRDMVLLDVASPVSTE